MNDIYSWSNDLYPLVTKRYNDQYAKRMNVMKQVIGEETTTRVDIREEGMGGFGEIPVYNGTVIPELGQKRGFVTTYTPYERAGEASISYKKAKVDMSGEAKKTGTRLANSSYMTVLADFYRLFSGAFDPAKLGADGQPWASASHPINSEAGAGVFSNLINTTFSIPALTAAQTAANRFVTYDGMPFLSEMDLVLIAPELEPKAKEFFGENAKLIPESAENGANPVYGMKYMVIGGGSDLGFSAKQWALADSSLLQEHAKIVYITKPMIINTKETNNPLISKYTAYMDYVLGFSEARPIIFSNPA